MGAGGVRAGAAAELEADSQGVDKTLVYRCIVEEDAGLDLVEKFLTSSKLVEFASLVVRAET